VSGGVAFETAADEMMLSKFGIGMMLSKIMA